MTIRQLNRQRRDERIVTLFRERYTNQPRPRKHTREYVLHGLAQDYCLSVATVEDIVHRGAPAKTPEKSPLPEATQPL